MKHNIMELLKLFVLINLLVLGLMSMPDKASASNNGVNCKHQKSGNVACVVDQIKTSL